MEFIAANFVQLFVCYSRMFVFNGNLSLSRLATRS